MSAIRKPQIDVNSSEISFLFFKASWLQYKQAILSSASLQGQAHHLLSCCTDSLEQLMVRHHPRFYTHHTDEQEILRAIEELAVKKQNKLAAVSDFLTTVQQGGESLEQYARRLAGLAQGCHFVLPAGDCDFTSDMVRQSRE